MASAATSTRLACVANSIYGFPPGPQRLPGEPRLASSLTGAAGLVSSEVVALPSTGCGFGNLVAANALGIFGHNLIDHYIFNRSLKIHQRLLPSSPPSKVASEVSVVVSDTVTVSVNVSMVLLYDDCDSLVAFVRSAGFGNSFRGIIGNRIRAGCTTHPLKATAASTVDPSVTSTAFFQNRLLCLRLDGRFANRNIRCLICVCFYFSRLVIGSGIFYFDHGFR